MLGNFFKYICYYFLCIVVVTIFVIFTFLQVNLATEDYPYGIIDSSDYVWPLPDHSYISSYFGYRNSPTAGASSYHSGIDIPAPEGTKIYSICDGIVTFASWGAGGGYTIVVENNGIKVSYCHVSPNFLYIEIKKLRKVNLFLMLVLKMFMVLKIILIMILLVILQMELPLVATCILL